MIQYHTAERSKGQIMKVVAVENGKVRANYCNVGDGVLVHWVLSMNKANRVGSRILSDEEANRYFQEREILDIGSGI